MSLAVANFLQPDFFFGISFLLGGKEKRPESGFSSLDVSSARRSAPSWVGSILHSGFPTAIVRRTKSAHALSADSK